MLNIHVGGYNATEVYINSDQKQDNTHGLFSALNKNITFVTSRKPV